MFDERQVTLHSCIRCASHRLRNPVRDQMLSESFIVCAARKRLIKLMKSIITRACVVGKYTGWGFTIRVGFCIEFLFSFFTWRFVAIK